MSNVEVPPVHDVVIIGAGPCGLAVAARLCEHTPSAIFTDEEHNRYYWIAKHASRATIKNKRTGHTTKPCERPKRYSTLVLDSSGEEWMAKWNHLFKTFQIEHLRSPMFFHPDPGDRDGLLAYTHEMSREAELTEIRGCVGKEVSKHKVKKRRDGAVKGRKTDLEIDERDRKDYYTPSSSLFGDYCRCIVDRYGIREGLIKNESVQDIDYSLFRELSQSEDLFRIRTDKGIHHARAVVLAVGAGGPPALPPSMPQYPAQGACHAMHITTFPAPSVAAKLTARQATNIVVVGGGLTSAQISDMAVRHGVGKVWHLMRGPLKVKPFDVDLEWMGKFKNHEKAAFWSADTDQERLEQIRKASGGGSITPKFHKILKGHVAKGRVALHTHTTIVEQSWDEATETCSLRTAPPVLEMPKIDFVYYATGMATDFQTLPHLKTMNEQYPVHGHGGLPCLNDDLMWRDGVPLFVTGRLASLRLGPGAGNLEGARMGAERIAWAIEEVLGARKDEGEQSDGEGDQEDQGYRYGAGIGSRYESLSEVDDA